jgi:hypothetical protein
VHPADISPIITATVSIAQAGTLLLADPTPDDLQEFHMAGLACNFSMTSGTFEWPFCITFHVSGVLGNLAMPVPV